MTNRHLTEEDLVLHRYGEAENGGEIAAHLESCEACRAERDRLDATLGLLDRLEVPERDEAYGSAVWRRLRPRLAAKEPRPFFRWWRPLAFATIAAALLTAAFLAGRFWRLSPEEGRALAPEARERILLGAVGDHLDRSQIALLEFVHAPSPGAPETARETRVAEELVAANRLYRQSASQAGETGVASVLDELERILLQLAHDPAPEARARLQKRTEEMLFKIRVIRSQVRQREEAPPPRAARS